MAWFLHHGTRFNVRGTSRHPLPSPSGSHDHTTQGHDGDGHQCNDYIQNYLHAISMPPESAACLHPSPGGSSPGWHYTTCPHSVKPARDATLQA